ncbi:hypothetical protein AVEN_44048-1 [Araneus ventricosus]|uniref:Sushi domain-containing protein n=1 Tax=Araneus ventricosus TaxID=182803 RepID=A0A4Y2HAF8_ARAVE|nr:hypothetical protein AVEN_44048-1 [Araneus ventricosus]
MNVQVFPFSNSSLSLCEIEVYVKDDEWCDYPPQNFIPNGQLEVNRSKAVLHCKHGFKEKDGRKVYATCENNTWSYLSLQCVEGEPQKDYEILACPPPDFPEGGKYEPVKPEYEVGQTITYSCNNMAPMFIQNKVWISGEKVVTCQSSGKWSRVTPFCETPTKIKSRIAAEAEDSAMFNVLDSNLSTCAIVPENSETVKAFSFYHEVIVYFAALCFGRGRAKVEIIVAGFLKNTIRINDAGKYISGFLPIDFNKAA